MAKKLSLDLGIKEYELGGGVLRINPTDPNLFKRFSELIDKLPEIEKRFSEKEDAQADSQAQKGEAVIDAMCEFDREVKQELNTVFGLGNDFDKLMSGVNLMSVGKNGELVLVNLIGAIEPIVAEGAKAQAKQAASAAVQNARRERSARMSQ